MHGGFWHWLQDHLLPCPFKWFTGIDCPGCGFQRSFLALLQGDLVRSLELYPATIPFLLLCVIALRYVVSTPGKKSVVLRTTFFLTGGIMMVSYAVKMYRLYVMV
ncbi:Protein of unknown function [Sinomicrobium oceani]|uniref:DUF2752 domain-containing protein n=1 Tax=Sinomicrobium oceani TaxID=1150368 RepID=A0A1K1LQ59_9FLAO|nr:DUF2752 domain-containing protein [Sinomicrobium oceani]SFW13007.1 Protein of unknown function [Sinomicrobium oceani]